MLEQSGLWLGDQRFMSQPHSGHRSSGSLGEYVTLTKARSSMARKAARSAGNVSVALIPSLVVRINL